MRKWAKITIILAVLVALGAFIAISASKPVKAELYTLKKTTVTYKFKEKGNAASGGETKLFCPIAGDIAEVAVKEGDRVSSGSLIARLDTAVLEYQIRQLEAKISSLEGQKASSSSALRQQISQLQSQLNTILQQEREAYKGPFSSQIEQQQKAVELAKSQLDKARADYDRLNELFQSGGATKKDLDDAEFAVKQAENQLVQQEKSLELITQQASPVPGTSEYYEAQKKSLQSQIDIANYELSGSLGGVYGQGKYYSGLIAEAQENVAQLRYQLSKSVVVAPFDGIIKEMNVKKGETVSPSSPIAVITPDGALGIDAYVLARDAIYLKTGDQVSIIQERKDKDQTFKGHISSIAPAAVSKVSALGLEEQRVKVTVVPEGEIPGIKPGYEFDVEFCPITQKDVLAVPASAVFNVDGEDAVWLVKNGKTMLKKVEKGITADEWTVITSGLSEGDKVVKDSRLEGVKEGVRVE